MPENLTPPPPGMTPEERNLEKALGALVPAAARIDRDAVMFGAGRAAGEALGRRRLWTWQAASAATLLIAAGLALYRPVTTIERIVVVRESTPAALAQATPGPDERPNPAPAYLSMALRPVHVENVPGEMSYLWLQRQVLTHGLGALPAGSSGSGAGPGVPLNVEGLNALPPWQRREVGMQGGQS